MNRKTYRSCIVPGCKNTSTTTPNKIFIDVPRKENLRKKWLEIAGRKSDGISISTPIYFCEDHFDLPNDMENYMRYHIMGYVDRVIMKPECLPSKFYCQTDRKRSLPSTSSSCSAAAKRQRLAIIQEALQENDLMNSMEKENTSLSINVETKVVRKCSLPKTQDQGLLNVETKVVRKCSLPKTQDKGVQAIVKTTYFRSKSIQTHIKSKNAATSPSKVLATSVSTSPFKVEENVTVGRPSVSNFRKRIMEKPDSDISEYSSSFQPSIPSVQIKLSSDTSSLNEEEAQLEKAKEAKQALIYMIKKIEAKPRLYIGITNECYFLVDMINTYTNIPSEHVLLCLKKIRLNTTFEELSDEFHISPSYAGKIFLKNIPVIANILKPFIVQLDKKNVKRTLPIAFRHRYNKVNTIIDCFEIEIEKPSKALHQALTWSEYKKGNTVKYLISSTPNGLVNYISPGFGGRISDTLLVEQCDFMEQLEPGSWVLADRGFKHIEQLLIQRKCHLLRPPSVAQGAKLTKQEAHTTKQIASLRIHIERVIRRIREFTMLKPHSVLNTKLVRVLDDCVIIACALINLQGRIIK